MMVEIVGEDEPSHRPTPTKGRRHVRSLSRGAALGYASSTSLPLSASKIYTPTLVLPSSASLCLCCLTPPLVVHIKPAYRTFRTNSTLAIQAIVLLLAHAQPCTSSSCYTSRLPRRSTDHDVILHHHHMSLLSAPELTITLHDV